MKIIFPATLDPIHVGHLMHLANLIKKHDVTVALQKYNKRAMSIGEVKHILHVMFNDRVKVFLYTESYAYGYPKELTEKYDAVATGNKLLIASAKKQQFKVIELQRWPGYRASSMRKMYEELKLVNLLI